MYHVKESDITKYEAVSTSFVAGCSKNIVVMIADGGNHFTQYGILQGMVLLFDLEKPFKKGCLSCYCNEMVSSGKKFKLSDKPIDGYAYVGRLVLSMRNYEV